MGKLVMRDGVARDVLREREIEVLWGGEICAVLETSPENIELENLKQYRET